MSDPFDDSKHKAARAAVKELTTPLRALAVILDTSIGDVLVENAGLRAQVESMERELEIWSGGATVPEIGRYYFIHNLVISEPGFHGAFWHENLEPPELDRAMLAAHNITPTDTHTPSHLIAFRYLGAHASGHVEQATRWRPCEAFLDREHSFAAPFLGETVESEYGADECPGMFSDDGMAVVHIRQMFLHHVHPLDAGEDYVRPTGADGTFGGLPKWLAWRRKWELTPAAPQLY